MKGSNPETKDSEGNTPLHILFLIFERNPKKSAKIGEIFLINLANMAY